MYTSLRNTDPARHPRVSRSFITCTACDGVGETFRPDAIDPEHRGGYTCGACRGSCVRWEDPLLKVRENRRHSYSFGRYVTARSVAMAPVVLPGGAK